MDDDKVIEQRVESKTSTYFDIRIRHRTAAVEVWVQAHSTVEEFFSAISGGASDTVDAFGRFWASPDPDNPVRVHKMLKTIDCYDRIYALDNPGGGFDESHDGNMRINISFLRLVGISSKEGVRFVINTPIHLPGIRSLESKLCNAVRAFIGDFIVPASVSLRLIGSEMKSEG